jgi:hypothetical protein
MPPSKLRSKPRPRTLPGPLAVRGVRPRPSVARRESRRLSRRATATPQTELGPLPGRCDPPP